MCTMSVQPISKLDTLINDLEHESYLKINDYFKDEVKTKIEEFSQWFSTARLYLLRCNDPQETEVYVYLLLNLRKKLQSAISQINKSMTNRKHSFTCNVCNEQFSIDPNQNFWGALQNHSHFEQSYQRFLTNLNASPPLENGASCSTDESISDEPNPPVAAPEQTQPRGKNLNDFKFNFVIKYDDTVEEALYPEPLVAAARKIDNLQEYSVQRCGVARGTCLLCSCCFTSGYSGSRANKIIKISPFAVKCHVTGQRHLRYAQRRANVRALTVYHDFWRGQEPNLQAHQLHFVPVENLPNFVNCTLCQERVAYESVLRHILDIVHKSRVVKLVSEGRSQDYYLLNMQGQVYGIQNNIPNVANRAKERRVAKKSEANGAVSPLKCEIVKFECSDPTSCDVTDLPPRYAHHQKFFVKRGDSLMCKICNENVNGGVPIMKSHVISDKHKKLSELDFDKYGYYCEICQVRLKNEDEWDDHFIKGPNRHKSVNATRISKLAEYECKTCLTVIYGDELSLHRHKSAKDAKSGKPQDAKLPFLVKKLFNTNQSIEEEAARITNEAEEVLNHQIKMNLCCADLEEALSKIYPTCKAYPFGSRISGLGNKGSDLDVFIDTGDMYKGERHQDSPSQERYVKHVSKLLKSLKEEFSSVVSIASARTPIVKVRHNSTKLECDISFRHGLGVENTKFLRFCIQLQPITQPFILMLKKWSEICKLNEHITNYGLALMAVFFLQIQGCLLSVKTMRELNPTKSLVIDDWETLNYTMSIEEMQEHIKPYGGSIKKLLRDFFFYFSKFDYANDVVCPLMGVTVPKLLFNEKPHENLPREMKSYLQRIETDHSEQFRGLSPFCIQDPFDLSHNLAKACNHGVIGKLKSMCTLTYAYFDTFE